MFLVIRVYILCYKVTLVEANSNQDLGCQITENQSKQ
jgi:hypothetical protein